MPIGTVEHLRDDQGAYRHCTCHIEFNAMRQLEFEQGDGGGAYQYGHDDQSQQHRPAHDWRAGFARRALHEARFGRLEGQGDGKGDSSHHVHPQDLHGGVSGRARPKTTAASITKPSAPLVGRMNRMDLRRLS
jgi:hypothetical protein